MAQFDETFDWVIVGSGGGAMTSALMMSRAGKSVVMLEKAEWVGGTTCKSGGTMWIPNNRYMDPGEDSTEKAITYLNAVVPDGPEFPGTSPERRATYAIEAPRMIDFLHKEGIRMERGSRFWPDYYDELAGGCKTSRTVQALPFDKKQLGDWAPRLRMGFLEMPVRLDDATKIPFAKKSWAIKLVLLKVALKIVAGKLTGKHWVKPAWLEFWLAQEGRTIEDLARAIDVDLVQLRGTVERWNAFVDDGIILGWAERVAAAANPSGAG